MSRQEIIHNLFALSLSNAGVANREQRPRPTLESAWKASIEIATAEKNLSANM
jgi:hypothetical protein